MREIRLARVYIRRNYNIYIVHRRCLRSNDGRRAQSILFVVSHLYIFLVIVDTRGKSVGYRVYTYIPNTCIYIYYYIMRKCVYTHFLLARRAVVVRAHMNGLIIIFCVYRRTYT